MLLIGDGGDIRVMSTAVSLIDAAVLTFKEENT